MKKFYFTSLVLFCVTIFASDAVQPPYNGGTGINNGNNTITVGGNLSTTGALDINSPFSEGSVLFAGVGGAISQNYSKFFWNNSLFRLGIGDANFTLPNSTLQVSNNSSSGDVTDGLTIAQFGSGDAIEHFVLNSGTNWTLGADQFGSPNGAFVIAKGDNLNNRALTINPSTLDSTFFAKVFLSANPSSNLEAATKQYVDTAVSTSGSAFLVKANNLSDLANLALARSNLGLGLNSIPQFTGLTLESNTTAPGISLINDNTSGSSGYINFSADGATLYGKINNLIVGGGTQATMQFSVLGAGGYQNYFELDGASQTAHFHKSLALDVPLSAPNIDYNTTNLSADGNNSLNTSQDINVDSSPFFAGLTISQAGGPGLLNLYGLSATNGQAVGGYNFVGANSIGANTIYAMMRGGIVTNTSGSERGYMDFYVKDSGGDTSYINLDGSTQTITANKNITAPGLKVSTLTASSAVYTDASKNLTSTAPAPYTYTPTLGDGTNNFATSTASGSCKKTDGHYYSCQVFIAWTSKGSASSGSQVKLSFPTTIGATNPRVSVNVGYPSGIGITGQYLVSTASSGTNYATFFGVSATGVGSPVTVSQLQNSGELQAFFSYFDN